MKKKLLIAAMVAILSLSTVSVMAAESPTADNFYNVTIDTTIGTTDSMTVKVPGGTITSNTGAVEVGKEVILTATPDSGFNFTEWKITGTYTIVSGSLNSTTVTILPAGDIVVNGTFTAIAVETTVVAETTTVAPETTVVVETTVANDIEDEDEFDEDEFEEEDEEDEEEAGDEEEATTVAPDSSDKSPQTGAPVAGVLVALLASGGIAFASKKKF